MDMNKVYDAIIIGGGPAGLAVGSELSADKDILLIEKNQTGKTTKSWFVPYNVVDKKVLPFTYNGVTRFMTKTNASHLDWEAKLFDRYPYVDEHAVLSHWADVIRQNGCSIMEQCSYQDHSLGNGIVSVKTSQGTVRTRLLIDASGYNSPVLQKYDINRSNDYWWSVYGSVGTHPNGLGDMKVGDYMLWQTFKDPGMAPDASMSSGRPVFEYEILDESSSFSFVFYLRKERMPLDVMEKEYMKVIRQEPSTTNFHDMEIKELKHGWYPSGSIESQRIAEDHVVFIGDAGCWTTPCGWGMTFILENYQFFSGQISELLRSDTLDKESLCSVPHYREHEKFEVLLDAIVTHFLSNATASELDRFINLFQGPDGLDKILCEKVFTLCVTREELGTMAKAMLKEFDPLELVRVLKKDDYILLVEVAGSIVENSIIDKLHEAFHHHHGCSIEDYVNRGFDID